MGVCTEERPVMHWQQSARFLGPGVREKSTTPPAEHKEGNHHQYCNDEDVHKTCLHYRSCPTCLEPCDHSIKPFSIAYRDHFKRCGRSFTEISDDTSSGVSLKAEPYGPPSSPESTCENKRLNNNFEDCAGCGQHILDRFYLSAVEKRWHIRCLQCYACRQPLDRESSCFSRDGNIYCKNDYYSFFGTRRCSGCLASISPTELVMRARNLVFHVSCFFCVICKKPLTKGDQFGIIDALIYCKAHYSLQRKSDISPLHLNSSFACATDFAPSKDDPSSPHSDLNRMVPTDIFVTASHVISGLPQAPRQKGRPRKRKPKDIEALTANIDLNAEYLDYGRGSHLSASSRTKRMRTSFKHHQLRTMKSYFAINHNPDAKDLKQLSQKTGLPKRVLQVWFQNARAKWRRMMMKQDGSALLEKGDGSLDLDSISATSPNAYMLGGPTDSPGQNMD